MKSIVINLMAYEYLLLVINKTSQDDVPVTQVSEECKEEVEIMCRVQSTEKVCYRYIARMGDCR